MTDSFLDKAEQKIIRALKDVRPELMQSYGVIEHETKHDESVVTELDKSIESMMREVLRELDPAIGVEGEEFGIDGNRDCYWLVDPIDGTEQFIRGMPGCKNLMALVKDGEVEWALMYMFVTDNLWLARRGKGVTCNGKPVKRIFRPLSRNWIDININLLDPKNVDVVKRVRPKIASFTAYRDTSAVVSGKIDGLIALGAPGGPWDYAPRSLLFRESGAKITNIGKETYDFNDNNFVMAHPDNFDQLMKLVVGDK